MLKLKIRKFRGLKDYYFSWGMMPVLGGKALAVLGRLTSGEYEGDLSNFTTPVAYGYERTTSKLVVLCDNTYVFSGTVGTTDLAELGHNDNYDNNMIIDQNDMIWVFADGAAKYWNAGTPRVWTDPSYSFTNGTANVFHPAALVQNYILIGDGNIVARIDASDTTYAGGDFTASALTLPKGFVISAIAQKGTYYRKAVIAANRNKKGAIFVWNCSDSSPEEITYLNEEIHALVTTEDNRTYAIIGNGVLYDVSAFPIKPVFTPPDNETKLTI